MTSPFELDAMQRLLLWRLAVTEKGEFLKEINTSLSATKRKELVRDGYLVEEKKRHPKTGRAAAFLTLDDKGWSWCHEHLRDELNTRSTQTTPILGRLLGLLADYFDAQEQTNSFGQLVLQALQARHQESSTSPEEPPPRGALEENIRAACLQLGNGRRNVRVRLADLRQAVPADRSQLDEKLLEMERRGEITLYPLDDPREVGPDDREAILTTAAGCERHILYFGKR